MYNDYMKVNNLTDDAEFLENECISKMLYAFRKYQLSSSLLSRIIACIYLHTTAIHGLLTLLCMAYSMYVCTYYHTTTIRYYAIILQP